MFEETVTLTIKIFVHVWCWRTKERMQNALQASVNKMLAEIYSYITYKIEFD